MDASPDGYIHPVHVRWVIGILAERHQLTHQDAETMLVMDANRADLALEDYAWRVLQEHQHGSAP
jgi:hypothetical protein